MTQPVVYMIAGPNGAGKTTAAMKLLPDFLSMNEFVNADEISRGLNPLMPEHQAMAAGRLMLGRIDGLIVERKSFAFETTGAGQVFADKLKQAKQAGYRTGLVYLWLPTAEMAKFRVRRRVELGGHNIPESDIERRFKRSLSNLINLYLPLVDEVHIYDSSWPFTDNEDIIATKLNGNFRIHQPILWDIIKHFAKKGER